MQSAALSVDAAAQRVASLHRAPRSLLAMRSAIGSHSRRGVTASQERDLLCFELAIQLQLRRTTLFFKIYQLIVLVHVVVIFFALCTTVYDAMWEWELQLTQRIEIDRLWSFPLSIALSAFASLVVVNWVKRRSCLVSGDDYLAGINCVCRRAFGIQVDPFSGRVESIQDGGSSLGVGGTPDGAEGDDEADDDCAVPN